MLGSFTKESPFKNSYVPDKIKKLANKYTIFNDVIYWKKWNYNHPPAVIRHFELIKCIPFYLSPYKLRYPW